MRTFRLGDYARMRITTVIAARNDEHTIDGVARSAGARVIAHEGRGTGAAIRMSLRAPCADFVAFLHGEESHDPRSLGRVTEPTTDAADR